MVSYLNSLEPSERFCEPFFVSFCSNGEAQFGIQTTLQYLRALEPATLAAKKAKNFWLKVHKHGPRHPEREQIRQRYPEEVESLRRQLWIKHSINIAEMGINSHYNRMSRPPLQLPASFTDLVDYHRFEPGDRFGTYPSIDDSHSMRIFLNVRPEDASRTFTLSTEDLQYIQEHYPEKVDRLRDLLWQRHISLKEQRADEIEVGRAFSQRVRAREDRIFQLAFSLITTISTIATAILVSVAIALSLPLVFIPASIFVCVSIASPITYFLTRREQ